MKEFKLFGGEKIKDLGQYSIKYVKENPDVEIYVGTDSKQLRKRTLYASVVVFYHPQHGAHVIFKREKVSKIKDLYTRLWEELERSRTVGEYLDKELIKVRTRESIYKKLVTIDLDFNSNKIHKSHMVYEAGVGLIRGCGFNVRTKPDAVAATCCADLLCKI